jgi:large exoprotein involved in heme utilization and adhesion
MGNESRISADALGSANGGNINIDTKFLIAQPPQGLSGSDIAANAFQGNGGRLDITASGIFGISSREESTALNDITASSEFGGAGVVTLNTPDVDPSQGLVSLPVELVDTSNSFATGCAAGGENEFIVTGRGGLPPSPTDTLSSDTVWSDLRSNPKIARTPSSSEEATNPTLPEPAPIVEATGWVINNKGEVVLTATAPTATRDIPWIRPDACHTP